MHIRRSPSGDGPTIYRPNESAAMRLDPPPRPVANEPDSIPPPPRDSLLMRVNRRRSQILTFMVSVAAIASFGSVVWWAHSQDVKAGGKGLEPLVVQAPTTPSRMKPENAGGLVPPNQDKEVYNRIAPGAVPIQPEKLLPAATNPKLPANGLPNPAAPKPPEVDAATARCHDACHGLNARHHGRQAGNDRDRSQHRQPDRQHIGPDRRLAGAGRVGQERGCRQVDLGAPAKRAWRRDGQPPHAGGARRSRRQGRVVSRPGRAARREAGPQRLQHPEGPQDRLRRGGSGALDFLSSRAG